MTSEAYKAKGRSGQIAVDTRDRCAFNAGRIGLGFMNLQKREHSIMGVCEQCGNDYDKTFDINYKGETHTFDSFECAIESLAPRCVHCGVRIIGHGIEAQGRYFCCAHCAEHEGVQQARDRVA